MPCSVSPAVVAVHQSALPVVSRQTGGDAVAAGVDGVPDLSVTLYRTVLGAANNAPAFLRDFAVFFTEAGIVVLGLLLVFGWWRARSGRPRAMAAALLTPAATVLAYVTSELVKLLVHEERPCRAVANVTPLTECPPLGDWSFPSNHSTIAGAAAMAVFVCLRGRVGVLALVLGALVAFSRVVVGVHYPHDVLVGFAFGLGATAVVAALLADRAGPLVERFREHPRLALLLGPGEPAPEQDGGPGADDTLDDETDSDETAYRTPHRAGDDAPTTVLARTVVHDTAPTAPLPRVTHWPPER